jgi:membrane protease YdiL (CAAX protease family)
MAVADAGTISDRSERDSVFGGKLFSRSGVALLAVCAGVALTQYIFTYRSPSTGVLASLALALGLVGIAALAPLSLEFRRCLDSLALLPLYVLLTASLPWFLLDQRLLLPAVYYGILLIILRHLVGRGFSWGALRALGFRRDNLARDAVLGMLIGVPTGVVEYLVLLPVPEAPSLTLGIVARDVVYMLGFVALAEELLFRAIIQRDVGAVLDWKGGLLISSLLFGVMHMTWRSPPELGFTFLAGLLLGYLYHRTGSLTAPIALHTVNNIVLVTFMPYLPTLILGGG